MSTEKIVTPNNSLLPIIKWYEDSNSCLVFKGSFLKQEKATFNPSGVINFLFFYSIR